MPWIDPTRGSAATTLATPQRTPADRAAVYSLCMAFISIVAIGLGVWLTNFWGGYVFIIGLLVGLATWMVGVGLATGALRNAYVSATPQRVRRRATLALVISAANLLSSAFSFSRWLTSCRTWHN